MKYIISLLLSLSILFPAYAGTTDADLNQLLKNIRSMRADFTQTIVSKSGKVLQQSRGRMAMLRPGQFRWEVTKPIKQLIIANGKKLWIYDEDLEQITIRSLTQATGDAPGLLLNDANPTIENDFIVKKTTKLSDPTKTFLLKSKNQNAIFSMVKMSFKNQMIDEIQLKDPSGQTTFIKFQNMQMNKPLSGSLFHLTAPKGIDVIDETRSGK